MNNVLLGEAHPLGWITEYFARIQFQNKGSPHIHMFLWIEGVSAKVIDDSTTHDALVYINKTISSNIPNHFFDAELHALVCRLQTHNHNDHCSKQRKKCRFGFPSQVSAYTRLLRNMFISSKSHGRFYLTQQTSDSVFINDYNSVVLRHWRANTDIQYIQNAEGAAFYVCSYICVKQSQMT